jgi:hypothetical protein
VDHYSLLQSLKSYYREKGIAADGFRCPHIGMCRRDKDRFVEATEAHIGLHYGVGMPRLAFVSLDPGSGSADVESRSLERCSRHQEWTAQGIVKNRHWYRTCEIAHRILSAFRPSLKDRRVEEMSNYFAHLNSAKCCENNVGNRIGDDILFDNCRDFLGGELDLVGPHILVTQGDQARRAVRQHFPSLNSFRMSACGRPQFDLLRIAEHPCLWYHTYHPNRFGDFNRQRREVILPDECLQRVVVKFIQDYGEQLIR